MKNFYLLFLSAFVLSCNSDDDTTDNCVEFHPAGIETVSPAVTIDAAGIPFVVGFRVTNGCGQFSSFEETTNENTTTIQVIAKYEGCICTEDAPLREMVYVFKQTTPGTYTLKFKMFDDNYISQTVVIE